MSRRYAVVLAGGSGERFWPVSTKERPKQFLSFSAQGETLLEGAYRRAEAVSGSDFVCLSTLLHLAESSREVASGFQPERTFVEPSKRNTAGALIWTAANLMAREPDWDDVLMGVLTADQRIEPLEDFVSTVEKALELASSTGGLVTVGIKPNRPETGFGYIEVGDEVTPGFKVARFREKPDLATAERYVESGRFLWNSGMFFWTLGGFAEQLRLVQPDMHTALLEITRCLRAGDSDGAAHWFEKLPSLSIDYALMEKAPNVYVVSAEFDWDDLGAWDALPRTLGSTEEGNTVRGDARFIEATDCIVSTDGPEVCLLGVEGLVVVVHEGKVLVIPKARCQEVKKFLSG